MLDTSRPKGEKMNWVTPLIEMVKWIGIISAIGFWVMKIVDFLITEPTDKNRKVT